MRVKKQLLSEDELFKLMELQQYLPRYQSEYMKLLSSYMLLQRVVDSQGENITTDELSIEDNKVEPTYDKITVEKTRKTRGKGKKQLELSKNCDNDSDTPNTIIEEAINFLDECQQDGIISDNIKEADILVQKVKADTSKKTIMLDGTVQPLQGQYGKDALNLYMLGYNLREIDTMMGVSRSTSATLHQLEWFSDACKATTDKGKLSIRNITKRMCTAEGMNTIEEMSEEQLMKEYKLPKEFIIHLKNRISLIRAGRL